jgi:hypothetical protein
VYSPGGQAFHRFAVSGEVLISEIADFDIHMLRAGVFVGHHPKADDATRHDPAAYRRPA